MSVASGKYNAHGDFFLSAPYNRVLVQRIKMRVPAKHRTYRGETKTWTILAPYGDVACTILRAEYPDATITSAPKPTIDRTPPKKAPIDTRAAFRDSVMPVLQRDGRICQYCNGPAAQVDQWQAGIPSPNTMVASCLSCSVLGRDAFFTSIAEKRAWLREQTDEHTSTMQAKDVPKREPGTGRYVSEHGIYSSRLTRP